MVHPSLLGLWPRPPKVEPFRSIREDIEIQETLDMLERSRLRQQAEPDEQEPRPRFFEI